MELKTLNDLADEAEELSFGGYTLDTLLDEAIKWYHDKDSNKHKFILKFFNLNVADVDSEYGVMMR